MTDQQILYEIRDRVTRLETKLDNIQDVKQKSYDAYRQAEKNKEDIREIKENHKYMWRTLFGLAAGMVVQLITIFVTIYLKGGGS